MFNYFITLTKLRVTKAITEKNVFTIKLLIVFIEIDRLAKEISEIFQAFFLNDKSKPRPIKTGTTSLNVKQAQPLLMSVELRRSLKIKKFKNV